MTTIINGSSPSITFSDSTTQTTAGLTGSTQQLCVAWVNYNGVTKTISSSYNVSSVTYNSAGIYTINFTNALSDANYAVIGSSNFSTGISWIAAPYSGGTKTASAAQVGVVSNNAYADITQVSVVVFR